MKYKQLPNVTIKFVCIRVKAIIVDEIFHYFVINYFNFLHFL